MTTEETMAVVTIVGALSSTNSAAVERLRFVADRASEGAANRGLDHATRRNLRNVVVLAHGIANQLDTLAFIEGRT